jgi:hypothetical protein
MEGSVIPKEKLLWRRRHRFLLPEIEGRNRLSAARSGSPRHTQRKNCFYNFTPLVAVNNYN